MAKNAASNTATAEDPMLKKPVTYTLTSEARRLVGVLARKRGLSQTGTVETAIRELARSEGVEIRE